MAELTIGQLRLIGSQPFLDRLRPTAEQVREIVADRIMPCRVLELAPASMPKLLGGRALGVWRDRTRVIGLSTENRSQPKTLGHEIVHVLDSDHLTRWNRLGLMAQLTPAPASWGDVTIGGEPQPYTARPEECIAVWGSAALFGYDRPAFASTYLRRIASSRYAATRRYLLDSDPALGDARLRARIVELEAQLKVAQAEADVWRARDQGHTELRGAVAAQLEAEASRLRAI